MVIGCIDMVTATFLAMNLWGGGCDTYSTTGSSGSDLDSSLLDSPVIKNYSTHRRSLKIGGHYTQLDTQQINASDVPNSRSVRTPRPLLSF